MIKLRSAFTLLFLEFSLFFGKLKTFFRFLNLCLSEKVFAHIPIKCLLDLMLLLS